MSTALLVIGLVLFYCPFTRAEPKRTPDVRLIMTGGLIGVHDGYDAFFSSPLFQLGGLGEVLIEDTTRHTYRFGSTMFFSTRSLMPEEITVLSGVAPTQKGQLDGMMGQSLFGVGLDEKTHIPMTVHDPLLHRELGAVNMKMNYEMRRLGELVVIALCTRPDEQPLIWPKHVDDLSEVPGIFASQHNQERHLVFFARRLGATARVFGVVDQLLHDKQRGPAYYMDLGNSLLSLKNADVAMAKDMQTLLMARYPLVLGASTLEVAAAQMDHTLLARNKPYLLAVQEGGELPPFMETRMAKLRAQFFSLGTLSVQTAAMLPKGNIPLSVGRAINLAEEKVELESPDLSFAMADTSDAIAAAISSPAFDAVFALVSGRRSVLPAVDDIDLTQNLQNGMRSVAPLVRVSSSDVTEVSIWWDAKKHVSRLRVERYSVLGEGAEASDASRVQKIYRTDRELWETGLPQLHRTTTTVDTWTRKELEVVLGQILIETSGAEMAIVEQIQPPTPIASTVSVPIAQSFLERGGHLVTFEVSGKYLRRILKLLKAELFDHPVTVVGGTIDNPTVSLKGIVDTEWYNIATTESVLVSIYRFLQSQSTIVENDVASTLVADTLGQRANLALLSELKQRDLYDAPGLNEWQDLIIDKPFIAHLVYERLLRGVTESVCEDWLYHAGGKSLQALVLDISDIDFGVNLNVVNNTVEKWKSIPDFKVPDNRLNLSAFTQFLINARILLKFSNQYTETDLIGSSKFYQTDGTKAPSADNTKAELAVRFPLERILDKAPGSTYLSPLLRLSFETQLWPIGFLTPIPSSQWYEKGWLPRNKNAYAFVGMSVRPLKESDPDTLRIGAISRLLVNNLYGESVAQAFDVGFEAAGRGKWTLGPFALKIDGFIDLFFPLVQNPAPDKLGVVGGVSGKVEFVIFRYLSLSGLIDVYAGSLMVDRSSFGVSTFMGLALSYAQRFKWMV